MGRKYTVLEKIRNYKKIFWKIDCSNNSIRYENKYTNFSIISNSVDTHFVKISY